MASVTTQGRKVERIGHRGAPRRFLENTLPSFTEALRLGADAVELDVHVTADREVVVHHDSGLSSSIAPGALRRRALSSLLMREIAEVDLGSGSRIPRLDDVLAETRGRATAYVEIKAGDVEAVAEVIARSGAVCAIHSFDHAAVAEVGRVSTGIPLGILLDRWPKDLGAAVRQAGARDVWPRATLITEARIAEIHGLGCRAIAWTVNDGDRARELKSWGVDGLCTDDLTLL